MSGYVEKVKAGQDGDPFRFEISQDTVREMMPLVLKRVNSSIASCELFYKKGLWKMQLLRQTAAFRASLDCLDLLPLGATVFQNVDAFPHAGIDPIGVETVFREQ